MPINPQLKPIYESFSMLHPDGTFMCHISEKRANWYVNRKLADWVDEKTFKLRFEPKGKGKHDLQFYTQKLVNRCVVCGDMSQNLNKHHVVPYVFRSRFPVKYKESNHHDVLVTCVDCHEAYEYHANIFKAKLVKDLGIEMNEKLSDAQRANKRILSARKVVEKVQSGELCDVNNVPLIPLDRLENLKQLASLELMPEVAREGAVWADKVMEKVFEEDSLFEFVKMWRQHFIDYTNPRFLPDHWSVEHRLEVSSHA